MKFAVAVLLLLILPLPALASPDWNSGLLGLNKIAFCPNPMGSDRSEWIFIGNFSGNLEVYMPGRWSVNVTPPAIIVRNVSAFKSSFPEIYAEACRRKIAIVERKIVLPNREGTLVFVTDCVHGVHCVHRKSYHYARSGEIFCWSDGRWKIRYQDWTNFKPLDVKAYCRIVETPAVYRFKPKMVFSYTFLTPLRSNATYYLDSHPVGGIPPVEFQLARNSEVKFLKSNSYAFFHYKFAIVENDLAVITTENWRWCKRGYIVEIRSEKVVNYLEKLAAHDSRYAIDSERILRNGNNNKGEGSNAGNGILQKIPSGMRRTKKAEIWNLTGKTLSGKFNITVFVMPDRNPVLEAIKSAHRRLYIEVPYIIPYPELVNAIKNTSKRVRILIVTRKHCPELEKIENVSLRIYPFPLHGKLIISDDRAIIVTANLDRYGMEKNREIGIIFRGRACKWLADNFLEDYSSSSVDYSNFILLTAILLLILAVYFRKAGG